MPFGHTAQRFLESYLRGVRPLLLREPAETAVWLDHNGNRMRYTKLTAVDLKKTHARYHPRERDRDRK